ncbi:MAG: flavodoxin family protein [Candidatus Schekmanbacteria bacterium]|nr:flavodoxin family protein [Candidatus Schekmanbacteria bacterium]
MNAVAIVGSPRKGSNTDTLVDKILEGIASVTDLTAEKIYIIDKNINYCTGCGFHLKQADKDEGKRCSQDDDMAEILQKLIKADILVFGTPIHMRTLSAPMLNFLTRMIPLLRMKPILDDNGKIVSAEVKSMIAGKRTAVVTSQGDPMAFSGVMAIQALVTNLNDFRTTFVGDHMSLGNLKRGLVKERPDELQKAFNLGVRLASKV